jgi:hypothetical protein
MHATCHDNFYVSRVFSKAEFAATTRFRSSGMLHGRGQSAMAESTTPATTNLLATLRLVTF